MVFAFVLVATLVAVTGAVGYVSVTSIDNETHLVEEDGRKMDASAEMIIAIKQQQTAVRDAQLGKSGAQAAFTEGNDYFDIQASTLETTDLSAQQQKRFTTIRSQQSEYNDLGQEFFEAKAAGNEDLAERTVTQMNQLEAGMEENAHSFEQAAQDDMEGQVALADRTARESHLAILALTVVAFIAAIAIGLFVARRIMSPVDQLSQAAAAASEGDLDTHPSTTTSKTTNSVGWSPPSRTCNGICAAFSANSIRSVGI
ncbi:HAMP domain-containing protein [Haladaptatus sp. DYF46]|uniref:HAMP domain-containing protein n=1 Tax=Haladaptatus sp. DYF46 TaxID=2886041 RepID=UPI0031834C8F